MSWHNGSLYFSVLDMKTIYWLLEQQTMLGLLFFYAYISEFYAEPRG
jgi:hypothetical protein